ncbi:MAG TPA: EAL domain-containing protein [Pyrinomonadaceae bacterium]|jgi:diguanylate cyclase (GGDEF)-like protein/PAS domain S-box-containing protein|nr:EAL domain-containing protein [Pyrinomonadaceae bacterium]
MTREGEAGVLVADDNPDKLSMVSLILGKAGYRVFTALDGVEAMEVARRHGPLLVVSDVMMPRADGIELCRMLRADPELCAVPVLLVSALRVDDSSVVDGLRAGADDYLEAPYDPMLLVAKVARLAERSRAEKVLRESEERFRLLVEGVRDYAIFMLDPEGRVASWNTGAERIEGYTAEEIIGEHCSRFYTEEDVRQGRPEQELGAAAEEGCNETEGWLVRKDGERFWADVVTTALTNEAGRLRGFSMLMRDVTERKLAEERMLHDALHDGLTGLANRALFMDRLGHAVERAKRNRDYAFAVFFLDLDRFKLINDSLGHLAGDRLLVEVGRRLKACMRAGDTVARLGGDEFTILLDDMKDSGDALRMAERAQAQLALPFDLDGHEVFVSASVGIALSAMEYSRPEDILRDANTAMHGAKSLGKASYKVFDATMHEHARLLLGLETDMRRAAERGEYRLHYQPIVSLETGRMTGFEALVRWQHPRRGLLWPAEFLSLAEETGLVIQIDRWVLREACRQAREWQRRFRFETPLCVSVNLSARHFSAPSLVEHVAEVLEESGLDACCLKLEITESVLMSDADSVTGTLRSLKEIGVELQLDDFGTGYSSLSYLHRFPVDALKIDRSFVGRIGPGGANSELARAIVTMAHSLGMSVVAEGVETEEQSAELRAMACEYGQGHLFSAAVDCEGAEALIARGPRPNPFAARLSARAGANRRAGLKTRAATPPKQAGRKR